MSGNEESAVTTNEIVLDDEMVRNYLIENDNFLQRNPDILDFLHIPHATGSAVSLVEKQVTVLRDKNVEMRHKLKALTVNAQDNDRLFESTRKLILSLLEADSLDALNHAFTVSMAKDFGVEHFSLIVFGSFGDTLNNCRVETAEDATSAIGALLRGGKPVCGALRADELHYLFPNSKGVGSAAMIPLDGELKSGLIAVGSSDANYYNNTVGTLFLSQIADVVVRLLPRFEQS